MLNIYVFPDSHFITTIIESISFILATYLLTIGYCIYQMRGFNSS